jgi:hypothetical protein
MPAGHNDEAADDDDDDDDDDDTTRPFGSSGGPPQTLSKPSRYGYDGRRLSSAAAPPHPSARAASAEGALPHSRSLPLDRSSRSAATKSPRTATAQPPPAALLAFVRRALYDSGVRFTVFFLCSYCFISL